MNVLTGCCQKSTENVNKAQFSAFERRTVGFFWMYKNNTPTKDRSNKSLYRSVCQRTAEEGPPAEPVQSQWWEPEDQVCSVRAQILQRVRRGRRLVYMEWHYLLSPPACAHAAPHESSENPPQSLIPHRAAHSSARLRLLRGEKNQWNIFPTKMKRNNGFQGLSN